MPSLDSPSVRGFQQSQIASNRVLKTLSTIPLTPFLGRTGNPDKSGRKPQFFISLPRALRFESSKAKGVGDHGNRADGHSSGGQDRVEEAEVSKDRPEEIGHAASKYGV